MKTSIRESDLLRRLFEIVLQRCIDEGLVGSEGFAADASLIRADVSERTHVGSAAGLPPDATAERSRNISPFLMMRRVVLQLR